MNFQSARGLSCLFLILGFLWGCGNGNRDPYQRQPVSGKVTFDGNSVENGAITFVPDGGGPVSSGGSIVKGQYQISQEQGLPPGTYLVSISAPDPGAAPSAATDAMMIAVEGKELLPEKFNTKSTLKCEIKKQPQNIVDFDLKSN